MAKMNYQFQVIRGNRFSPVELWAWKWGHWGLSPKWTSEGSPDADSDTANARKDLQKFQNLLMLAVPSTAHSPFAKGVDPFDKVIILAYEEGNSTGTPARTTTYETAEVVDTISRDFTALPWKGQKPKYVEVLLSIGGTVTVT